MSSIATLFVLLGGTIVCFSVLFILIRILKRQKRIQKNISFQESFSSKEPFVASVPLFLWLGMSALAISFTIRHVATGHFAESGIKEQAIQIGLFVFFAIVAVHQLFHLMGLFKNKIEVNGLLVSITNQFGTRYDCTPDQIISLRLGSRRRPDDCSLTIVFFDDTGRRRSFSMFLHWEPFLLFKLWAQRYHVPKERP